MAGTAGSIKTLILLAPVDEVETLSDALDALDALSVSVEDADAHTPAEQALFGLEELATSWGKLALSGRIENSRVESLGSAQTPRFEVASRDFHPEDRVITLPNGARLGGTEVLIMAGPCAVEMKPVSNCDGAK